VIAYAGRSVTDKIVGLGVRPYRDDGGDEIVRCLASTRKVTTLSTLIRQRHFTPVEGHAYRGEKSRPGEDHEESLSPHPELENSIDPKRKFKVIRVT
jgi:hypothetical protein